MSFQDVKEKATVIEVELTFKLGDSEITSFPIYSKDYTNDSNRIQFKQKLQSNDPSKWKHDNGDLPELKSIPLYANLLMSLHEAKEISDTFLTKFINPNSNNSSSLVLESTSTTSNQNMDTGDVEEECTEEQSKKVRTE